MKIIRMIYSLAALLHLSYAATASQTMSGDPLQALQVVIEALQNEKNLPVGMEVSLGPDQTPIYILVDVNEGQAVLQFSSKSKANGADASQSYYSLAVKGELSASTIEYQGDADVIYRMFKDKKDVFLNRIPQTKEIIEAVDTGLKSLTYDEGAKPVRITIDLGEGSEPVVVNMSIAHETQDGQRILFIEIDAQQFPTELLKLFYPKVEQLDQIAIEGRFDIDEEGTASSEVCVSYPKEVMIQLLTSFLSTLTQKRG